MHLALSSIHKNTHSTSSLLIVTYLNNLIKLHQFCSFLIQHAHHFVSVALMKALNVDKSLCSRRKWTCLRRSTIEFLRKEQEKQTAMIMVTYKDRRKNASL